MRTIITLFLVLGITVSFGQKKQVCFSYDDLPFVNYGISDSTYQKQMVDKLIVSLKMNGIPAIGFVNEGKLYDKDGIIPFKYNMLKNWFNSGLELGNHTWSHPDYNRVSLFEFTQNILMGEKITKEILAKEGKTIKYFRHPFLHVGNTNARADSLDSFLVNHGYTVAPVTIDNEDYLFAVAYKRAKVKNDSALFSRIGVDYIDYMERKLKYYEKLSENLFGRNIAQILLLHASMLNSDFTDSLAVLFRRNNYEFVSMGKVLEDKAYESKIDYYSNCGVSWVDKWALTKRKNGAFFKDEPLIPDYIKRLAE